MSVKNILVEIEQDIADVTKTNFVYSNTAQVPNAEDAGLTYERDAEKKGKKLNSCVLYVDIRNSVVLTEKHHSLTMGKIYTAFTKAVLKVARYHDGHTRNIIGDRVMVVFPATNCFTNAVDCAISINHIAHYQIRKLFPLVDFTCGIGIDFGELKIIKVGIQRNGTEGGENKGLVWAGYPANIASRLTDNANKTIEKTVFEVNRHPISPAATFRQFFRLESNSLPRIYTDFQRSDQPDYLSTVEKVHMSPEQFADSIAQSTDGYMYTTGGKMISFSKKKETVKYPPILMTEVVYSGFKKNNPTRLSIINNNWKEQKHEMKNVSGKVYGGDVTWEL